MTSMHGTDPSWMLNFTKEIQDLRKPQTGLVTNRYTLAGLLQHDPEFSLFNFIVRKAKLECILNDYSANLTLMVPSDRYLKSRYPDWFFVSMDYLGAKEIVYAHLLNRKVTLEMLMSSEGQRLSTYQRHGRFNSFYTSYNPKRS